MSKHEPEHESEQTTIVAAKEKMSDVAEGLGNFLGDAESRLMSWIGQRDKVFKDLVAIRDKANKLLQQAGYQAQGAVAAVTPGRKRGRPAGSTKKAAVTKAGKRRGRPPGTTKTAGKRGRPKGTGMSAEGRAKIAAAQKARWAAKKAAAS